MWPLGHVGHVTYSFINILFISTGIFDYKLRPHMLSVGTTANSTLSNGIAQYQRWTFVILFISNDVLWFYLFQTMLCDCIYFKWYFVIDYFKWYFVIAWNKDNHNTSIAALRTVLPVLFKYCYKYCYSDSRKLWAVMKAAGLAL
jgi:hypothetical protein